MKYLLSVFMLLCSTSAMCDEGVSLNFKDVPVLSFVEAAYKGVLGRDYLIAPNVVGMDARVTVSIKSVQRAKLPALVADVLQQTGLRVRDVDGLLRIERLPESQTSSKPLIDPVPVVSVSGPVAITAPSTTQSVPEEIDYEVYRPQNRTADYLNSVLRFASGLASGGSQTSSSDVVVVSGSAEKRRKLMELLHQLDSRPAVVNVRAALVEFSDTQSDSISVGGILSVMAGKLSLSMGSTTTTGSFLRWKTGSIDSVLGALAGDSRFRYRTQPSIRLIDGEQGRLQVGSDVPTRGSVTVTSNGQQVQSTEYKSSGVVLTVLPRVLGGRVQAHVLQEVSSFVKTDTSAIDSPTLNKRSIEATVDAEDDEVVVLAGLDEDTQTTGHSGLASWLPLARSNDTRTTQIVVLLEFKRI